MIKGQGKPKEYKREKATGLRKEHKRG